MEKKDAPSGNQTGRFVMEDMVMYSQRENTIN